MTTLRTIVVALAALCVLAVPPATAASAAATRPAAEPVLGELNPAFVRALYDPMVALGLGRMPSPVEVDVSRAAEARAARRSFPPAYNLVAGGLVTTPVRDQGNDNTCWAFSNIAALESAIIIKEHQTLDLSEDNLVVRSGFWSTAQQRYQEGGYDFMAIAYFARWAGPLLETDDPYVPRRSTHPGRPVQRHVQEVISIPGRSSDLDNDLIKQLVTQNGALSVGMYMDQNPSYLDSSTNSYYYPTTPPYENHGVAIVGWDDTYPAVKFGGSTPPPGDGAFLVRNSWGAGWEADGYFYVSYYDKGFARDLGLGTYGGCTSYATVADTGDFSRNYGYDKLGATDRIGYRDGSPIWAANRFTAASARPITAVGFYTLSSGTPYEVWAGRTFKTLKRQAKGTQALPGYHTVMLSRPLKVARRRPFIVAIKLTSPDGTLPLAVERRKAFRTDGGVVVFASASATEGQSYVGPKRWRLRDLTRQRNLATANICLKAFAR